MSQLPNREMPGMATERIIIVKAARAWRISPNLRFFGFPQEVAVYAVKQLSPAADIAARRLTAAW